MATNLSFDGGSPFRIKRPLITTNGFVSDPDPLVTTHLNELNALLGKRIFAPSKPAGAAGAAGGGGAKHPLPVSGIPDLLQRHLTPRRAHEKDLWAPRSLAATFHDAVENDVDLTLSDYIDMTPDLSSLKYAFQGNLTANWFNLDFNTKTVLDGYPAITDYLIAFAYHVMNLKEVNGLKNFILSNQLGAKNVANYAIVSAARTLIDNEQLNVPDYDVDNSEIVVDLKSAGLSLSAASFKSAASARIDDFIFNGKWSKLIDGAAADIGPISPAIRPLLIKYLKSSPVPITNTNIKFFLPLFINQSQGTTQSPDSTDTDTMESDKDFNVDYFQDDNSLIKVSASAVKCSAQLYYGMVLGDELRVFEAMNHFTNKYLLRGGMEIQDSRLRDDLQMYVFSNRFTDLRTGKVVDRTRPAERHMFYRQVFNHGRGQVAEDLIVNTEFPKLWKVLILESAKYLERAQAAFNPDSYVSRNNVMQSVEDLQYNLSTHCTGMANVITPIIYAELNFIIKNVFMHREVLQQVVPQGGTWWRVVETLYLNMKHRRPKATVYYNKAKLGQMIIRSIAEYNPATFEDDGNFSAFISNVDSFISTQSILQDSLTDQLKKRDEEDEHKDESHEDSDEHEHHDEDADGAGMTNRANGRGDVDAMRKAVMPTGEGSNGAGAATAPAGGAGEWDF